MKVNEIKIQMQYFIFKGLQVILQGVILLYLNISLPEQFERRFVFLV